MDDFYNIPVNSDPKHGLGLLASDVDTFQFPTLFEELDNEHLLTLDDPQSFCLAFSDAGVFGVGEEAVSRATTAETPQSECSTRTTLSTSNISPSSDFLSYPDQAPAQEVETMYYDTTQTIISGRQSRAASATWPAAHNNSMGLTHTSNSPSRPVLHRPQSFSNRPHHLVLSDDQTPPPPSSLFPSPNLQPQMTSSRSPFLSPNMQSPHMPQISQLPAQNAFMQAAMPGNASQYFVQNSMQQRPTQQQLQQQFQERLYFQLQQQQNLAQQQVLHEQRQNHAQMATMFPQHHQLGSQTQMLQRYSTPPVGNANSNTISSASSVVSTPNSLPNTTGNSSTGYQCFSHGCGGRHFSNWGNLVRHHRERQLRSKAGAKPTCPRCGKGFTRSSARDAHVAGLKCVLGRRRRGASSATTANGGASDATATTAATNASGARTERGGGVDGIAEAGSRGHGRDRDGEEPMGEYPEHEDGSEGSQDDGKDDRGSGEEDDFLNDDGMELLEARRIEYLNVDDHDDDGGVLANVMGMGGGGGGLRPAYLAPQQLQFQH